MKMSKKMEGKKMLRILKVKWKKLTMKLKTVREKMRKKNKMKN
jgi:hypothetical protein